MELSFDVLAMLFGIATIAGFIDAIAGGGGLLTIPALLSAGTDKSNLIIEKHRLRGPDGRNATVSIARIPE